MASSRLSLIDRSMGLIQGQQQILGVPQRILLIQLGDIGDVVLTLPCLEMLNRCYPQAKLAMAVRDRGAELLTDCPWLDDYFIVASGLDGLKARLDHYWRFFRSLRQGRYDLVIDLRTGTRGAIMAWLSGARQRLSFYAVDGPWWRNMLFTGLLHQEYELPQHVINYLLDLLASFGVTGARPTTPRLHISPQRQQQAKSLLAEQGIDPVKPLVAVQPFSLWRYKEWGTAKFSELCRWLIAEYGVEVIITGAVGEEERAKILVDQIGQGGYNLAGKTDIGLYGAVLGQCDLFIGVDSAGVHIAAAADTPTVALFGPSAAASWAPRGEEHLVITNKDMDCVPCRMKGCNGLEQSRCLEELTVAEVKNRLLDTCASSLLRGTR